MARSKAKKGKKSGEMKKEQSIYHEIGKGQMSNTPEDPYTMEETGRERE
jgi:hypothetical protein